MLDSTHQKGEIAFLKCAIRAAEKSMVLSRPTTEARYDAILDDGARLLRVQVKYGAGGVANATGSVSVDFRRKSKSRNSKTRVYHSSEIDAMMVYLPSIDKVILLPPSLFAEKMALTIRTEPSKNGQKKRIILAADYIW